MWNWLQGKKTYIVFGVVLLNGILNLFGWGLELPEQHANAVVDILAVIAIVLRYVTTTPVFKNE